MKKTEIIMGMPVTVDIVGNSDSHIFKKVFDYFRYVDGKFSTYKKESEISKINRGEIFEKDFSSDMKLIFQLAEQTKKETDGYFDMARNDGVVDPSGIVKGWTIFNAAEIIARENFDNFYVDAGGDVEARGLNSSGKKWGVGVRNPFNPGQIVQVLEVSNMGVATSGTYERGLHIYNPKTGLEAQEIASITVVGPNVYEADRMATAAFAMGVNGIGFIEKQKNLEGYAINNKGIATLTSGFEKYLQE